MTWRPALEGPDQDVAGKVKHGGPWELDDLPVLGKGLKKVESLLMAEVKRNVAGTSAGLRRDYLAMQRAYYEVLRKYTRERADPDARRRLEAYRRARRRMLDEMAGADEEERSDALEMLKHDMLRRSED